VKTTAILSSKSQITIPAWARRQLGIGPGDRVVLREEGGRLVLEPAARSVRSLRGALRGLYGEDPDRWLEELRREWDRGRG
jgi:AbrB family looped-hinge helix DNA binding protein